jgi:hypothetical protein
MANYDFKSLSSYDFELLIRDLLQADLNINLQTYKPGKDKGIDIRGFVSGKNTLIVQCKHYASSKFANLYKTVKDDEVENIIELDPSSYILATSLSMNPSEIDRLFKLAPNYFGAVENIIDCSQINNLLNKHPSIEKQHFKLWLTSSTILERIFHSGIINRSNAKIKSIKEKLKYYVANDSYHQANRILEQSNYLIISGIAGIGKSTLAEIIIYQHLSQGYEFIEVTENINEAWDLFKPDQKQIFYYDDFLGRTSIADKLGKNEDQSILTFIKEINTSKNKRFILTTREHILRQARIHYERLADRSLDIATCIVDLVHYTKLIKAKILYNHLYFSEMPDSFKLEILKGKLYTKIIDHANFSPRIIETMVNYHNLNGIRQIDYAQTFLNSLANPHEIWNYAFTNQISESSRTLLAIMLTVPDVIDVNELQDRFLASTTYKIPDFIRSLKELDGSFIRTSKESYPLSGLIVKFHNPSIVDFLHGHIYQTREFLDDLIGNATDFEQLMRLWGHHFAESSPLRKAIISKPSTYYSAVERLLYVTKQNKGGLVYARRFEQRLLLLTSVYEHTGRESIKETIQDFVYSMDYLDVRDASELLVFLKEINHKEVFTKKDFRSVALSIKKLIFNESKHMPTSASLRVVIDFLESYPAFVTESENRKLKNEFLAFDDYKDEFNDISSTEELNDYFEEIKYLAAFWEAEISEVTSEIEEKMQELDFAESERDDGNEDYWKEQRKFEKYEENTAEAEIESMFNADSLKNNG